MQRRLAVLAAGGTGGHMFPAEALAAALESRGFRLALVTDRRGGGYGEALARAERHEIAAGQIAGRSMLRLADGVVRLAYGTVQAGRLLGRLRPDVVVGFGGYAAFPTVLAAALRRMPTVIHEQNALLGRANRLLARRVRYIATAFEPMQRLDPALQHKCVLVGNPVRAAIAAVSGRPYPKVEDDGPINVLVTGGSQGATVFSEVVPQALERLTTRERARLRISQQCRAEDMDTARAAYAGVGMAPELATFFEDLPERLAAAHLAICRAGASTVAECTAAGRPAIYVPYPYAADDHQTANASAIAAAGAGWVMPQPEFTPDTLALRLHDILNQPETLATAAASARRLGHPNAATKLADLVDSLVVVREAA